MDSTDTVYFFSKIIDFFTRSAPEQTATSSVGQCAILASMKFSTLGEVSQLLRSKGYEFDKTGQLVDITTKSKFELNGSKQQLYDELAVVSAQRV